MLAEGNRLKKELKLFDIFAISTGAMFSSGFFLLPGLAAAQAGPAVILAYFVAGIFMVPAMLSMAELSTAMPRAGGPYYFLDRSLGPLVGTVGGLGEYLALALKSAFALVGMGAYLAIFVEVPIKPLAVALTVAFMGLNIIGAKETSKLQAVLVVILLSILAFFTVQGLFEVASRGADELESQMTPFMPFGVSGLLSTVGFIFVSYAGLTKVATVAEEARDPERDIPLGMILSLVTATISYVVGVFIIVAVLDAEALHSDLTPVATAAETFFDWLPQPLGLVLIVAAAIAAFASTGNAGLMSASRYPLAMARDRLLSPVFARVGRFQTPVPAILLTGALMTLCILALDVSGIAKLASAFQLLIFLLINVAVIVMRESRIEAYDPGFHSPLYPWMQVFGILGPILLIALMGWMAIVFTIVVIIICLLWYRFYARDKVTRDGAIYHWFERLGRRRYAGLDSELRGIIRERGLRDEDPFEDVVARADVFDISDDTDFEEVVRKVAESLDFRIPLTAEEIESRLLQGTRTGSTPVTGGIALPHIQVKDLERPELVLIRSKSGISIEAASSELDDLMGADSLDPNGETPTSAAKIAFALFFLASPADKPGQHLRILAKIAEHVDQEGFMERWLAASDELQLKQLLLRDDRFLSFRIKENGPTSKLAGQQLRQYDWPEESLVALIQRGDKTLIPHGNSVLQAGDRVTVIGSAEAIDVLRRTFSAQSRASDRVDEGAKHS